LRTQLGKDVTVFTVAHRLQTIMDADRIVRFLFPLSLYFPSPRVFLADADGSRRRANCESLSSLTLTPEHHSLH